MRIDISHGKVFEGSLAPVVNCEMTLKVTGFKQTDTAPDIVDHGVISQDANCWIIINEPARAE